MPGHSVRKGKRGCAENAGPFLYLPDKSVFQFPSLLPALTVLQNVTLPAIFRSNGRQSSLEGRARELLATVGLAPKLHVYPRQLSAGQQHPPHLHGRRTICGRSR
jgi:ABC-type ATPase involved in cell division